MRSAACGLRLAVLLALAGQGAALVLWPLRLGSALALSGSAPPLRVQCEPGRVADAHELPAQEIPPHAAAAVRHPERTTIAELTWLEAYARAELLASHQLRR